MLSRSLAILLAGFLAAGAVGLDVRAQDAATSPLGVQGLTDDEAKSIQSMIEEWTKDLHSGDMAGWEKYWTKDAVLSAPDHERLVGEASIAAFAKANFGKSTGFSFDDWSIAGRKDLAVVTNTLQWGEAGAAARSFNQMIVLRRTGSGDWRVQSVMYNSPS